MEKLYSPLIDEGIFYEKLSCGLEVYIMPKKQFAKKFAFFGTRYGGLHNRFVTDDGVEFTMPRGIAHFLEHQIFEDDQESTFEKFEKIGANVNAYTSNTSTVYHMETVDHFENALELLIDFVLNARITDDSVAKEREVIVQEIKMYEDEPEWLMGANLLKNLYHNHPVRYDIAGTEASVRSITKEQLLTCFNYFYTPKNMAMFLYGDIDPEHMVRKIETLLPESYCNKGVKPKLIIPDEPIAIKGGRSSYSKKVSKNNMVIGFKSNPTYFEVDRELKLAAMRVAGDLMFGKSSDTFAKLYQAGIISDGFDFDIQVEDGYAYSIVGNQSNQLEILEKEIISTIEYHLENGFNPEDFNRLKRKLLGRFVASFNSLQSIAGNYTYKKMRGFDLFEQVEAFNALSLSDIEQTIRAFYDMENRSVSILLKAE
ncbi:EF-P 5-aminopentanol modification-associated protein YfmH [Fusibacter tunisiensis]|uniref:Zn-dependent peptidase n=1 Tax=Fusibacter tunisiensis TaxID=1008308 RepID=A0ABS2MT83_9FIRM|nr:pitrilysin family protein [Fusibacter tunisiensis]MBM7562646.1 putative Zn-dependent peptidase [Fusibacter tunisiensis]